MKSIERFFRRYILSTIGILILFFLLNILLLGAYFVIAGLGNVKKLQLPDRGAVPAYRGGQRAVPH